jgi:hypothetical protein
MVDLLRHHTDECRVLSTRNQRGRRDKLRNGALPMKEWIAVPPLKHAVDAIR